MLYHAFSLLALLVTTHNEALFLCMHACILLLTVCYHLVCTYFDGVLSDRAGTARKCHSYTQPIACD